MKRGFIAVFLMVTLLLSSMLLGGAFATQEDMLSIQVTTDKAAYQKDEIATLNVKVVNHTAQRVFNLQMENLLPAGLEYVYPSEASYTFPTLEPGATATHSLRVRMLQAVIPQTGDYAHPVLWTLTAGMACLGVCLLLRRRRNAGQAA